MADALEIEQTAMIDREMDQVFDWARVTTCLFVTLSGTTKWKQMATTR